MPIKIRTVDTATVFDLSGNLTMGKSAQEMGERIREALEGGARSLALNLAEVNYIDSWGIGTLVSIFTSTKKAGAKCVFFGVPLPILAILKMAHLDAVFEILPDETSAVSRLLGSGTPHAAA